MSRRSCMAGVLFVLVALMVFAGCSSSTTGDGKIYGDPNSSSFQKMRVAVSSTVDSTLASALRFAGGPGKYSPQDSLYVRPDWGVLNPLDTLLYNYVDGWNIFYLGLTTGIDYNVVFVDSARFWDDNGYVDQYYSYHVNKVDYIHHGTNTYKGDADDYMNKSGYIDVTYNNFSAAANNISGVISGVGGFSVDDYYRVQNNPIHDEYDFAVTMNQIGFTLPQSGSWKQAMPTSGTMTITGLTVQQGDNNHWTITVTFSSNGTAQIHATTGNTIYQYQVTPAFE